MTALPPMPPMEPLTPAVTPQPKASAHVFRFTIPQLDCPTEAQLIRKVLEPMSGVQHLEFNLLQREVYIHSAYSDSAPLKDALMRIGMVPRLLEDQTPVAAFPVVERQSWRLWFAGSAAAASEMMAWAGVSESSAVVIALASVSVALVGFPVLRKGMIALRHFTLNIYFLMSLAVTGALLIGKWPEAAMVIFLFAIAEWIEARALDRARNAVHKLMSISPEFTMVLQTDGRWISTAVAKVPIGAMIRVGPGERVPLDGIVVNGSSAVDQSPITGESLPVEKQIGATVFAGALVVAGVLEMRVEATQQHTQLARIVASVQQAQSQRAPTQRWVDQFAKRYTPAVVCLAVLTALFSPILLGWSTSESLYQALVLLVIACPCAMVISVPVTVVSGLAAAARHGILIKGGQYLEQGRQIGLIVFDKTGTLTTGKLALLEIQALSEKLNAPEALEVAAALDAASTHPIAKALVYAWEGARSDKTKILPTVSQFEALVGLGVQGICNGNAYALGNSRLLRQLGLAESAWADQVTATEAKGQTAVLLCDRLTPLALFAIADEIRPTSLEAIQALQRLGVETALLSGDNAVIAQTIGKQLGMTVARGNLLPEEKRQAVESFQQRIAVVAMVGDGLNDAPALAQAQIGFAMGAAGSDTAVETADVALMDDDPRKLALFIQISQRTVRVLSQNIAFSLAVKALFLGLAFIGQATLWMAIFADVGASLIVIANGLRLSKNLFKVERAGPRPGEKT